MVRLLLPLLMASAALAQEPAVTAGRAWLEARQLADGRQAGALDLISMALVLELREDPAWEQAIEGSTPRGLTVAELAAAFAATGSEPFLLTLRACEEADGGYGDLASTAWAAYALTRWEAAADPALDHLAAAQRSDGRIGGVATTALAATALALAGRPEAASALSALESAALPDGGYGDAATTGLALRALPEPGAPLRAKARGLSRRAWPTPTQAALARIEGAALQRLLDERSEVDGFRESARVLRDTAAAARALGPGAARNRAYRWLNASPRSRTERLVFALESGPDEALLDALEARQGPEGGFGDLWVAARAVPALRAGGRVQAAQRTASWLADAARPGGGWGLGLEPDLFTTLTVLAALALVEEAPLVQEAAWLVVEDARGPEGGFASALLDAVALETMLRGGRPRAVVDQTADHLRGRAVDGAWNGDAYLTARAVAALDALRANLALAPLSLEPGAAQRGAEVEVVTTVRNRGFLPAEATTLDFEGQEIPVAALAPGEAQTIRVPWVVAAGTVCATLPPGDSEPSDDRACLDVSPEAGPLLTLDAVADVNPPSVQIGGQTNFVVRVWNFGPDAVGDARLQVTRERAGGNPIAVADTPLEPIGGGQSLVVGTRVELVSGGDYLLCAALARSPEARVCVATLAADGVEGDAIVEAIAFSPARVAPGDRVEVEAILANLGRAPIPQVGLAFELEGERLAPITLVQALAEGERRTLRLEFDAPGVTGDFALRAVADPEGLVAELSEGNNVQHATLSTRPPDIADLRPRVEGLVLNPAPVGGQPFELSLPVQNQGGLGAQLVVVRVLREGRIASPDAVLSIPGFSEGVARFEGLRLSAGAHLLEVVVDAIDVVPEAVEVDNRASFGVLVAGPAGVDVAVAQPRLAEGHILVELRNRGDAPSEGFVLRLEGVPDEAAVAPMAVGEARTIALQADLAAGVHAVTAVADLVDADPTNNQATARLAVGGEGPANLVLLELGAVPEQPAIQAPFTLRAQLHNIGGRETGFFARVGEAEQRHDPLGPGATQWLELPAVAAAGEYCLVVVAEGPELDLEDNRTCVGIEPSSRVDLVVESVTTSPPVVKLGVDAALRVRVRNLGVDPTVAAFSVGAQVDGLALESVPSPPLEAGEAFTLTLPWPNPAPAGPVELKATADSEAALSELREANNTFTRAGFVVTPDVAELAVAEIDFEPERPASDAPLGIRVRVSNYGDAPARGFHARVEVRPFDQPGNLLFTAEGLFDEILSGQEGAVVVPWPAPEPGQFEVRVALDPAGVVPQTHLEDDHALALLDLRNRPPELTWAGARIDWARGGIWPGHRGATDTDFVGRIRYTDPDGDPPGTIQICLEPGGGAAERCEDLVGLDEAPLSGGRLYEARFQLPPTRELRYRFEATDSFGEAAIGVAGEVHVGPWVLEGPHVLVMPAFTGPVGQPVSLWGLVWRGPSDRLEYSWRFGDGSEAEGAGLAPQQQRFIEAKHTYDAVGVYVASLEVVDIDGRRHTAQVPVTITEDSHTSRRARAISWASRAIYQRLLFVHQQIEAAGEIDGSAVGEAALAALALLNHGHREDGALTDPFTWELDHLISGLLLRTRREVLQQHEAVYDQDGDGLLLRWIGINEGYQGPMAMLALMATGEVELYGHFIQGAVEWVMRGQNERGGFRYRLLPGEIGDNSVTQWAAHALGEAARCPFEAEVPDWVFARGHPEDPFGGGLLDFLDHTQRESGLFTYMGTGQLGHGPTLTAAGLIATWAASEPEEAPLVQAALGYLEDALPGQTFDESYFSYAFYKAMRLREIETLGGVEWQPRLEEEMLETLSPNGDLGTELRGTPLARTALGLLTLAREVVGVAPVAVAGEDRVIWPGREVCFDGSASFHPDPRRHLLRYEWDLDGDEIYEAEGVQVCTTFGLGEHLVRLRVLDDRPCEGRAGVDTVAVLATEDNHPPEPCLEPRPHAFLGQSVSLDASCSGDSDGDALDCSWDLDGNGACDDAQGCLLEHDFDALGVVLVGVCVCDPDGECRRERIPVEVLALQLGDLTAAPDPFSPSASPGVLDTTALNLDTSARIGLVAGIFDDAGQLMRRVEAQVGPGRDALVWDGRDEAGEPVPSAVYGVSVAPAGEPLLPPVGWRLDPEPALEDIDGGVARVRLPDGRWRLYFGRGAGLRSALSEDGVSWVEEGEARGPGSDPSVLRLADGSLRVYFATGGEIRAADTVDGLQFDLLPAVRVPGAAPSAVPLAGGGVRLYYAGPEGVYSAHSEDGLAFVEEGLRIADATHPEALRPLAGGVGLYFLDGEGIRRARSADGLSFGASEEVLDAAGPPALARLTNGRAALHFTRDRALHLAVRGASGTVEVDDVPPQATLQPVDRAGQRWLVRGTVQDRNLTGWRLEVSAPGRNFVEAAAGVSRVDDALLAALDPEALAGDPPPSGLWRLRLSARDRAGNESLTEAAFQARFAPLDAPRIDTPTESALVVAHPLQRVGGEAEPGALVELDRDGERVGTALTGADRRWSLVVDLPRPGPHVFIARARRAELLSEASNAIEVTLDPVTVRVSANPEQVPYGGRLTIEVEVETRLDSRLVELTIERGGVEAARVGLWTSQRRGRVLSWLPGDRAPGDLEVVARVRAGLGAPSILGEARAPFTLAAQRSLQLSVATDAPRYSARSPVQIRAAARSGPGNADWIDLSGTLEVFRGQDLMAAPTPALLPIGDLPPASQRQRAALWNTADLAPATYRVLWQVGEQRAEATFEIESSAEDGGGLDIELEGGGAVEHGEGAEFCAEITNEGNDTLEGPVFFRLLGAEGEVVVIERQVSIEPGESERVCVDFDTGDREPGDYRVLVEAGDRVIADDAPMEVAVVSLSGRIERDEVLRRLSVGLDLEGYERVSAQDARAQAAQGAADLIASTEALEVEEALQRGLGLIEAVAGEAPFEGRLVPTGAAPDIEAFDLSASIREIEGAPWAFLEPTPPPVEVLPALDLPDSEALEVQVESVSALAPQWLVFSAPVAADPFVEVLPGQRAELAGQGGRLEVLLFADLRHRGELGVAVLPIIERVAANAWLLRFPLAEGEETRVHLRARSETPPILGVAHAPVGLGARVSIAAAPGPEPGWDALLAAVERALSPPPRPREGGVLRLRLVIDSVAVPAEGEVELIAPEGTQWLAADGGQGSPLRWQVDLQAGAVLEPVLQVPAGPLEFTLRATRTDAMSDTVILHQRRFEVEAP